SAESTLKLALKNYPLPPYKASLLKANKLLKDGSGLVGSSGQNQTAGRNPSNLASTDVKASSKEQPQHTAGLHQPGDPRAYH
ncbi:MAG: hypothetical protein WBA01_13370, partial [Phormidesmis sp.]